MINWFCFIANIQNISAHLQTNEFFIIWRWTVANKKPFYEWKSSRLMKFLANKCKRELFECFKSMLWTGTCLTFLRRLIASRIFPHSSKSIAEFISQFSARCSFSFPLLLITSEENFLISIATNSNLIFFLLWRWNNFEAFSVIFVFGKKWRNYH